MLSARSLRRVASTVVRSLIESDFWLVTSRQTAVPFDIVRFSELIVQEVKHRIEFPYQRVLGRNVGFKEQAAIFK